MSRILAVLAGVAVLAAGAFALISFFAGRDDPSISPPSVSGPGRLFADRGAEHRPPDRPLPADAAGLPLSGPHRAVALERDRAQLSPDAALHALELGNVVLVYGGARPPVALTALQEELSGPFSPELAAAGQAVVLARVPGHRGVAALAWRRALEAEDPSAPELRAFVDRWLGRGVKG